MRICKRSEACRTNRSRGWAKLLTYPGQIFTRIQLMDEIWGTDSETGWETVTVHVGRLRKRFEGWNEFEIVAVRGLGYKAVKKV